MDSLTGRRPMRRSRFGCRNCKLRKIKCDEGKPRCKRCNSFGVICNYMPDVPDLQSVADDSVRRRRRRPLVVRERRIELFQLSLSSLTSSGIWTADASTSYQLNAKCQDFITRYLARSLITPDDPNMIRVNRKLLGLAFTNPFLMHASLAVALVYDRYLNGLLGGRQSLEECHHWSQATTLLNRRLRDPIEANDKDAIWGTAAALAVMSFACPGACTPAEAWPLKSCADPSLDFEWLRMSEGKMSLWHIINPLRRDSLFCVMASTYAQMHSPLPEEGIDGMPRALATVCHLDKSSTSKSNPYFKAAHALSQIQNLPDSQVTTGQTELFTLNIHRPFKLLLREKDPVALLLLYLWYRKGSRSIWWIELRARVECPSICSYLRLYRKEYGLIQEFLPGGSLADEWAWSDSEVPG